MEKTITIKNELPELLEAVCNHADCPEWLPDIIWNGFNNRVDGTGLSAHWFRYALYELRDTSENSSSKTEYRQAAESLSEILRNPNTPTELKNGILSGLDDLFNHRLDDQTPLMKFEQSPEYIETLLDSVNKQS